MATHNCLNCGEELAQNYCPNCGQKASTHRFSLKHIFSHDYIHGVFHFDKGFFYTAKQILLRPGHTIREYIDGKRVNHYNYFAFIILLVAANVLLVTATDFRISELYGVDDASRSLMDKVQLFQQKHRKEFFLLTIPIYSLLTAVFFRRAKQNYAEHLVLNTYREGGVLLIDTISLVLFFPFQHTPIRIALISLTGFVVFCYNIWFYVQYFMPFYQRPLSILWRALVVIMLVGMIIGLIAFAVLTYLDVIEP